MTDMGRTEKHEKRGSRLLLFQVAPWGLSMLIWSWLAITQEGELRFWYVALIVLSLAVGVTNLLLFRKNAADNHTR